MITFWLLISNDCYECENVQKNCELISAGKDNITLNIYNIDAEENKQSKQMYQKFFPNANTKRPKLFIEKNEKIGYIIIGNIGFAELEEKVIELENQLLEEEREDA